MKEITIKKAFTPMRIIIGLYFLCAGLFKIFAFNEMVPYVSNAGLPLAQWVLALALVLEVSGGLFLLTKYQAKLGATITGVMLVLIILVMNLTLFTNPFAGAHPTGQPGLWALFANLSILAGLWGIYKSN